MHARFQEQLGLLAGDQSLAAVILVLELALGNQEESIVVVQALVVQYARHGRKKI